MELINIKLFTPIYFSFSTALRFDEYDSWFFNILEQITSSSDHLEEQVTWADCLQNSKDMHFCQHIVCLDIFFPDAEN